MSSPQGGTGTDAIVLPFGPASDENDTLTLSAPARASRTRLQLTTSFLRPNSFMLVPSQAVLITSFSSRLTRSSSRVTLSAPSFTQMAVTLPADKESLNSLATTSLVLSGPEHPKPASAPPAAERDRRIAVVTTNRMYSFMVCASQESSTRSR